MRRCVVAYFTAMGLFVSGVLGFFGYNEIQQISITADDEGRALVADVNAQVKAEVDKVTRAAQDRIDSFASATESRITAAVERSQKSTVDANAAATATLSRLEIIDSHLERREALLLAAEAEARRRNAELSAMQGEVTRMQGEVGENLDGIRSSLSNIQTEIGAAQEGLMEEIAAQSKALRTRNIDQTELNRAGLSQLAQALESLALQVEQLAQQVDVLQVELPQAVAVGGVDELAIEQVKQDAQAQQIAVVEPDDPQTLVAPVVYFQFAGVPRGWVEEISDRLGRRGFEMPGEERPAAAAGKREIRYFWEADSAESRRLRDAAAEVLAELGFESAVTVEDYTAFTRAPKPRPGTLALWLQPVRLK